MTQDNGEEVILNTSEEEVAPESTETEESIDDVKDRLAKAEEIANNYKIRAEKAERKGVKPEVQSNGAQNVSIKDIYALSQANVHQDDISEVEKYAKYEGISVTEALKTTVLRSILNEKNELRNTASATNTGAARRSSGKVSDEALISNANKGNLPDNDEEIDRLVRLKMLGK